MNEVLNKIRNLSMPREGFNIFEYKKCIWGIGPKGETVFGINSHNSKVLSSVQTTKYIKLFINYEFNCIIRNRKYKDNLSLYILMSEDLKMQELFVRICYSMQEKLNEEKMIRNFFDLKDLFSNKSKPSFSELQGMFGELFTIYYLKTNYNLDISCYYQKEAKRKFDFSVSEKKKIEIKSTIKPERVHHFLHQQLDTDRFDIKIVSLMLQKDDCGMSLLELINKCKIAFSEQLFVILYIETMIKNIDDSDLDLIKFNFEYAKNNFSVFNAYDVPRIKERNVNGIFNVEYDIDLENIKSILIGDFINWVAKD